MFIVLKCCRKRHQSEANVSENKIYKFSETGSGDELFFFEATPSQPEVENIPDVQRGVFNNSLHCGNDKKMPLWMNIVLSLLVFLILILFGIIDATQGPCSKYPRKAAAFCQIGQSILGKLSLKENYRTVKSVD